MMRVSKLPEVRKQELVEVALELFHSQGYDKTSVEQITKRSGVAKGVFYYYFSSKEAIFEACIDALVQPLLREYIIILTDESTSPLARLRRYVDYNFDLFEKKQGSTLEQALHGQASQGFHDRVAKQCADTLFPHFETLIEAGKNVGEFAIDDTRFTATALLGALTGIHERYADASSSALPCLKSRIYGVMDQMLNRRSE